MKKLLLLLNILFFNFILLAQNNLGKTEDVGRVFLTSFIPDQVEGLTSIARSTLNNKLNQIATKNGVAGGVNSRFVLTANVAVVTKDITPTAPPMHAYTLEVTFYIGDGIEGSLFASTSVSIKGVGETETKAYNNAFNNIKPSDPTFKTFVENGKNKIIEYYNDRCDFILKEAEMLASKGDYDAAIYTLVAVPEVCKDCYAKCMDAVAPIYQKQIDQECKVFLKDATNAWNAKQDGTGASQAAKYLSNINPNAACYAEAEALAAKIAKRIYDLDKREWDFKLKKQQDGVDIEMAVIQGARDVGVAYGNNQPKTITSYNIRGWW